MASFLTEGTWKVRLTFLRVHTPYEDVRFGTFQAPRKVVTWNRIIIRTIKKNNEFSPCYIGLYIKVCTGDVGKKALK